MRISEALKIRISTHTLTWSVTIIAVLFVGLIIISTHTLTWSVTFTNEIQCGYRMISTHTLTWSVTSALDYVLNFFKFQLTRSRGA